MRECAWLVVVALLLQAVSGQEAKAEESTPPPFAPPAKPEGDVYFAESFSDVEEVWRVWIRSEATKEGAESNVAKYDGNWKIEPLGTDGAIPEDEGLVLPEAAKHYAIAAKLDKTFLFEKAETLVVQYEVNFQNGLSCGGAYIKLLTSADNLNLFQDSTPYSIMFGPDKCGQTSKVHLILRYKNPVTGEIEEKHSKQSTESLGFFDDKKTHLFTLLIRSDGVYHIIVDQKPLVKGNLLDDFTPPIVPPEKIDDPEDRMPENWDEREKIPDPEAVKPDDWDEDAPAKIPDANAVKPDGWLDDGPEYIPDPDANMPDDWDEEEDGEYEPPLIPNPACEEVGCGEWRPPMIQNPAYKGKWKPDVILNPDYDGKWSPRTIDNPSYFEDETPFYNLSPIAAVGFELWTMSENIFIDNVIVCGELVIANNYAYDGWVIKMEKERSASGSLDLGSWLDWYVELANTYPYLWALYAVALVLPFVCCIGCCCIKSKPKSEDETARRKKTDEPSPDDIQRVEEEEDEASPKLVPVGQEEDENTFMASADDEQEDEARKSPVEEMSQEESEGEGAVGGGTPAEDGERSQEEGERSQEEDEETRKVETSPSKKLKKRRPRRED